MGIAGAGLSTTISQYISMFVLVLPYLQGKTQSRLQPKYVTCKPEILNRIFTTGLPSLSRQGLNSLSTMVFLSQHVLYRSCSVLRLALVKVSNRLVHLTMVQKSTVV